MMKLPLKNTRLMDVLNVLHKHGPYSLEGAIAVHGKYGLKHAGVAAIYDALITAGCAKFENGEYRLSRAAQRYFEPPAPAPMGEVATRNPIDVFSVPPLDPKKYGITPLGSRPGSNDYRAWPSVNAPFSKPAGE